MKGKCNCGKKATSEWMVIYNFNSGSILKFCDDCKPNKDTESIYRIDDN